ncbi:spermidine synthase [Solicola gregarius]|uniref:Spermidine synthase n=1 Tax=Solicola gregarius TaxID=2908642 RepID=A0AA46YN06_9ACTN|nr:hypothetical protein [Solicola gregarius]UYM06253.1 hypothetical protein L0C25_04020 [Solicola gregarius]
MEWRAGDAALRRRADGALELRVGGVFVMDDVETSSERLLARTMLDGLPDPRHVLVGGLGLGYTLREILGDPRIKRVTVAELEPAIPAWMHDGMLPGADLLTDPRVDLRIADVREVVDATERDDLDAILLDVDNGPGYLVHEDNAELYERPFLQRCADVLAPGGQLCVWSMAEAPELESAMQERFGRVETQPIPVRLQGRAESYWLVRGHGVAGDSLAP